MENWVCNYSLNESPGVIISRGKARMLLQSIASQGTKIPSDATQICNLIGSIDLLAILQNRLDRALF